MGPAAVIAHVLTPYAGSALCGPRGSLTPPYGFVTNASPTTLNMTALARTHARVVPHRPRSRAERKVYRIETADCSRWDTKPDELYSQKPPSSAANSRVRGQRVTSLQSRHFSNPSPPNRTCNFHRIRLSGDSSDGQHCLGVPQLAYLTILASDSSVLLRPVSGFPAPLGGA